MAAEREWDPNQLATMLGGQLGESQRDVIQREVPRLVERVKRLESVVTDPHALWSNWLRGDIQLPAGIGDIRECAEKMKRFRSRWLAAHQELRRTEDMVERAEERVRQLEASLRECTEWIYWESTNDSREATDVECYQRAVNLLKP